MKKATVEPPSRPPLPPPSILNLRSMEHLPPWDGSRCYLEEITRQRHRLSQAIDIGDTEGVRIHLRSMNATYAEMMASAAEQVAGKKAQPQQNEAPDSERPPFGEPPQTDLQGAS